MMYPAVPSTSGGAEPLPVGVCTSDEVAGGRRRGLDLRVEDVLDDEVLGAHRRAPRRRGRDAVAARPVPRRIDLRREQVLLALSRATARLSGDPGLPDRLSRAVADRHGGRRGGGGAPSSARRTRRSRRREAGSRRRRAARHRRPRRRSSAGGRASSRAPARRPSAGDVVVVVVRAVAGAAVADARVREGVERDRRGHLGRRRSRPGASPRARRTAVRSRPRRRR